MAKVLNFQMPMPVAEKLLEVRQRTGLSHARNLAWGVAGMHKKGMTHHDLAGGQPEMGRVQKVVRLDEDTQARFLELKRQAEAVAGRRVAHWEIVERVLRYCDETPPAESQELQKNQKLAAFSDEELAHELYARGFRVERR